MTAILFKRFLFSRLKNYDSTDIDSNDDEDEMDYLSESSDGEAGL